MAYPKDFYPSLSALKRDLVKDKHYRTKVVDRGSDITVIAPHGGFIEPGSSYIARAVAGSQLNLYDFQGLRRRRAQELHVTSTRFRDRRLNDLLLHTRLALSIHSMGEPVVASLNCLPQSALTPLSGLYAVPWALRRLLELLQWEISEWLRAAYFAA